MKHNPQKIRKKFYENYKKTSEMYTLKFITSITISPN